MDRLFYGDFVEAEVLKPHSSPFRRHHSCSICSGKLSHNKIFETYCGHDMGYEIGFCASCGWWDLIYTEWGMQDEPEEFAYLHAIIRDLSESERDSTLQPVFIEELRHDPGKLYDLPPRKLEELISDLVRSIYQCDVEITKQTRDGGKDIIGFDSNRGKFIIEVKRYRKDRKVGVDITRQLIGTMCIDGVQRGLLVTTSSYSRDALALPDVLRTKTGWELELMDFRDICTWLQLYHHPLVDCTELETKLDARLYSFPKGKLRALLGLAQSSSGAS